MVYKGREGKNTDSYLKNSALLPQACNLPLMESKEIIPRRKWSLMEVLWRELQREVFGKEEMAEMSWKLTFIPRLGGPIGGRHVTGFT